MFAREAGFAGLHAPDFAGGGPWINSAPISIKNLRGQIVLVDFWTYTCANCLRVLPHVEQWHRRYLDKELTVVGVHTPEFDFEKDAGNVRAAVARLGTTYPVVLDNDYRIWQAYANRYWPHRYLVDQNGVICHDHAGEGAYMDTERWIQALMGGIHQDIGLPPLQEEHEHVAGVCYPATAETYCGYTRGALANPGGYRADTIARYTDPGVYADGRIYLNGKWDAQPEYLRQASTELSDETYLALAYHALELNMVAGAGDGGADVFVTIDGSPALVQAAGLDLVVQENGDRSYVHVEEPRLYNVVRHTSYGPHAIKMWSDSERFRVYAFTFGGCSDEAPLRG